MIVNTYLHITKMTKPKTFRLKLSKLVTINQWKKAASSTLVQKVNISLLCINDFNICFLSLILTYITWLHGIGWCFIDVTWIRHHVLPCHDDNRRHDETCIVGVTSDVARRSIDHFTRFRVMLAIRVINLHWGIFKFAMSAKYRNQNFTKLWKS